MESGQRVWGSYKSVPNSDVDPILDQAPHMETGLTSLETGTPWNSVSAAASLCPTVCSLSSEQGLLQDLSNPEVAIHQAQPPPRLARQLHRSDWRRRRYDVPGSVSVHSSFDCQVVSTGRASSRQTNSKADRNVNSEGDSSGSTMGPMPQNHENAQGRSPSSAYAAGPLQRKRLGFFWLWRWCVLEHCELLIYSDEAHRQQRSEAPLQRFDARDFIVHWDPLEPQEFQCSDKDGAVCVFRTGSAGSWEENAAARLWVQALRLASTSGASAWSAAPLIF